MARRLQPDFDYKSLLLLLLRWPHGPRDSPVLSPPFPSYTSREGSLARSLSMFSARILICMYISIYEHAGINRSALRDRGNVRCCFIARHLFRARARVSLP